MKRLVATTPHYLHRLVEELYALPALAPRYLDPTDKLPTAVCWVESDGGTVTITYPDDAAEADIQAVLAAHDPTPPAAAPSPPEALLTEIDTASRKPGIDAATALQEVRKALANYFQSV